MAGMQAVATHWDKLPCVSLHRASEKSCWCTSRRHDADRPAAPNLSDARFPGWLPTRSAIFARACSKWRSTHPNADPAVAPMPSKRPWICGDAAPITPRPACWRKVMRVPVEGLVAASMRAQALFTGTYRGPDLPVRPPSYDSW